VKKYWTEHTQIRAVLHYDLDLLQNADTQDT